MRRLPDLFLGAILAVAVFALGTAVGLNYQPPPTESDQRANHSTSEIQRENFGEWLSRDATGFFTPWIVVIGVAQLGLFLWQLWLIRESLDDAKIAADAAKDGARAARDSADIARLSMVYANRAYVHHNGFRWISHRQLSDGSIFWRLRPSWINSGNSPTRHLRVYIHYEIRSDELPADYAFRPVPHLNIPTLIAPHGAIESAHRDIPGVDMVAVQNGTKRLYVWGTAEYYDVFPGTPQRVTKFCAFVDAVMGNPLKYWDEKTNNVELRFANYHRHNCADQDCEE